MKFAATQEKSACADSRKNRQSRANEIRVYTGQVRQSRRMKFAATQEKSACADSRKNRQYRRIEWAATEAKSAQRET